MRSTRAAGFHVVTRERTSDSKFTPLSSYVRYLEGAPMVFDPVLQDYLKEDLTYKENKGLARQWQEYSGRNTL